MKKAISISVILIIIITGSLIAKASFSFFNARTEGQNVFLEWKTDKEVDLIQFGVERKALNSTSYTTIAYIKPNANQYYTYTDENIYKTTDNLYTYRIAIYNQDNTIDHSDEEKVSVSLSSVKRTWGSIKAMFR